MNENTSASGHVPNGELKFCKHCGSRIPAAAVICTACGCQVEELHQAPPTVIINNSNMNTNTNYSGPMGRLKSKWVSLLLCIFLGALGVHKFYEGKIGMGILYIFTGGLFCIGVIVDLITLLLKPNPYYVR